MRAQARAARMLGVQAQPVGSSSPEQRIALAIELTRAAWAFGGQPWPRYERSHMPVRVIRR